MKTTSSRMTHPIAKVISSNNFVFTSPSLTVMETEVFIDCGLTMDKTA